MDPQQRAAKEQGILEQIKRGLAEGFRITPEDRRDLLWEIRDAEGKSEPPRGTQVFGTQPLFDAARQAKTVHPKQFGWLPVDAINNETFIRRANAGLNFGPSPMELIGEQVNEGNLGRYKEALHQQSRVRKGAFLGGALASEINCFTLSYFSLVILGRCMFIVNINSISQFYLIAYRIVEDAQRIMTSARPQKVDTPLPEGLEEYFDEWSMNVLENFGIDAPSLLNEYCCAVEDALIKVNDERNYLRQHVARLETQLATLVGLLREDTAEQPQSD